MSNVIEIKNGNAYLEIGQSDISGEYKQSPNGKYFIICDTFCSPTGNNDKECAVVFTEECVCYKKAIPNNSFVNDFYVFDDGRSLIVTEDEDLIRLDESGKQIAKRSLQGIEEHGFHGQLFYCLRRDDNDHILLSMYDIQCEKFTSRTAPIISSIDSHGFLEQVLYIIGANEHGDTVLSLYDFLSDKFAAKVIPNIECDEDDKDQYSCDVELEIVNNNFIFVYANRIDAVAFDLRGNQIDVPENDHTIAVQSIIQKEELRKMERSVSQYEYWSNRLSQKKQNGGTTEEIERAESEVEKYKEQLPSNYFVNRKLDTLDTNSETQELQDQIDRKPTLRQDFTQTLEVGNMAQMGSECIVPRSTKPSARTMIKKIWKMKRSKVAAILVLLALFGSIVSERTKNDIITILAFLSIAVVLVISAINRINKPKS